MAFNNLTVNHCPPCCYSPPYPMCIPGGCVPHTTLTSCGPFPSQCCAPCGPFRRVFNPCAYLQKCKSAEIIGGEVLIGCECEKFNGLQDDCKRSECRGDCPCFHRPATCRPSAFSGGKHLGTKYYRRGSLPYCKSPGPIPLCTTY